MYIWTQCMLTFILFLYILLSKGKSILFVIHKCLVKFAMRHLFINTFVEFRHFSLLIMLNGLAFVNFKFIIVIEDYPSHIYSFLCISYKY